MFDHGAVWSKNGYVSHRNPALYLDDIQATHFSEGVVPSAECRAKVLPAGTTAPNDMSFYNRGLASGNVARFNLVIPNVCEGGSDLCGGSSGIAQFDTFLRREIPRIRKSPRLTRTARSSSRGTREASRIRGISGWPSSSRV